MTERNVGKILENRARQAGLRLVLAQYLRHTAIRQKLEAGLSYPNVRRLFGPLHADTLARHEQGAAVPFPLQFLPRPPIPHVGAGPRLEP